MPGHAPSPVRRRLSSSVRRRPSTISKIISSETARPIKAKLHVQHPLEGGGGTKVYIEWSRSHDQDGRHGYK